MRLEIDHHNSIKSENITVMIMGSLLYWTVVLMRMFIMDR